MTILSNHFMTDWLIHKGYSGLLINKNSRTRKTPLVGDHAVLRWKSFFFFFNLQRPTSIFPKSIMRIKLAGYPWPALCRGRSGHLKCSFIVQAKCSYLHYTYLVLEQAKKATDSYSCNKNKYIIENPSKCWKAWAEALLRTPADSQREKVLRDSAFNKAVGTSEASRQNEEQPASCWSQGWPTKGFAELWSRVFHMVPGLGNIHRTISQYYYFIFKNSFPILQNIENNANLAC